MDEKKAVDVGYLNFSKPFDTVSHNIFTEKLTKYKADTWAGNVVDCKLTELLDLKLVIGGTKSNWRQLASGVSQGSILV